MGYIDNNMDSIPTFLLYEGLFITHSYYKRLKKGELPLRFRKHICIVL